MKTQGWSGLFSNASPYAVPPGAATVQVNLTNAVPGQLQCRRGMLPVVFIGSTLPVVDVYPHERDGVTSIIGLTTSGELIAMQSPSLGQSLQALEPQLSVNAGEVQTSYTRRYLDGAFGAQTDPTPTPPSETTTNLLDGNPSSAYVLDAESQCDPDSLDAADGGSAGTGTYNPVVSLDDLCDL